MKAPEDETMKWKRNAKDGVSPVIAVILMVAITVVLAGVVVLWVTRLSKTEEEAPEILNLDVKMYSGNTTSETTAADDDDSLVFTVLSGTVNWNNYKITIDGTTIWSPGNGWSASATTTSAGESVTFTEQGTNKAISTGETYNVKIINIEQQKVVWEKDVVALAA